MVQIQLPPAADVKIPNSSHIQASTSSNSVEWSEHKTTDGKVKKYYKCFILEFKCNLRSLDILLQPNKENFFLG